MKLVKIIYKGYRFRSVFDARCAMLFDQLGLKWKYEPIEIEINEESYYTPSFYLEDSGWFVDTRGSKDKENKIKVEIVDGCTSKFSYGCLSINKIEHAWSYCDQNNGPLSNDMFLIYQRICGKEISIDDFNIAVHYAKNRKIEIIETTKI